MAVGFFSLKSILAHLGGGSDLSPQRASLGIGGKSTSSEPFTLCPFPRNLTQTWRHTTQGRGWKTHFIAPEVTNEQQPLPCCRSLHCFPLYHFLLWPEPPVSLRLPNPPGVSCVTCIYPTWPKKVFLVVPTCSLGVYHRPQA